MQKVDNIIEKIQDKKILVIGDMIADVYVDGRISRVSREAPVLVLEEVGEKVVAGGAANVVANVATLGGEVYALGVLGDDQNAESLRDILSKYDVHIEGLVLDKRIKRVPPFPRQELLREAGRRSVSKLYALTGRAKNLFPKKWKRRCLQNSTRFCLRSRELF